jgi:DNA-binding MarR family transcriptional regulator
MRQRNATAATPADHATGTTAAPVRASDPVLLVELLFFAYRDFIGEPDRVLVRYGFGRAHHRVLHFVSRHPGLTVAELLSILDITKQSLGRVLRDLIESGFVEQREGPSDRRQRLMHLTADGQALADELLGLQTLRIARALEKAGAGEEAAVQRFLIGLLDPGRGAEVARLTQQPAARGGH